MSGCNTTSGFLNVDLLSVRTQAHRDPDEFDLQSETTAHDETNLKQEFQIQHEKFVAVVTEDHQVAVFGNYDEYALSCLDNWDIIN